ncbi:hypothetical protein KOR42_44520 [Thalassoglobus neptunius]|uniref:RHS Repeat protein n=1 Tax=Thalassoglobus neptunius TaxID=1938619 RepID=A0A5C5W1C7_9PLAN|nr:hypothetical protein [Thalassoglobus neptunius]TWT43572.1 hypothetical protein KOR42_44520 [Thalassoglobus neptunius]
MKLLSDFEHVEQRFEYDATEIVKTNNSRGLLYTIEEGMTTHLTRAYHDSGRLTGQTFGNSVSETHICNNDGTVASIAGPGGMFAYSYDKTRQLRPPTGQGGRWSKVAAE